MSFLRSFEPSRLVLQLSEPSDGGLAFSQTLLLKKKCHFIILRTVVHTGLRIESWLGPIERDSLLSEYVFPPRYINDSTVSKPAVD